MSASVGGIYTDWWTQKIVQIVQAITVAVHWVGSHHGGGQALTHVHVLQDDSSGHRLKAGGLRGRLDHVGATHCLVGQGLYKTGWASTARALIDRDFRVCFRKEKKVSFPVLVSCNGRAGDFVHTSALFAEARNAVRLRRVDHGGHTADVRMLLRPRAKDLTRLREAAQGNNLGWPIAVLGLVRYTDPRRVVGPFNSILPGPVL